MAVSCRRLIMSDLDFDRPTRERLVLQEESMGASHIPVDRLPQLFLLPTLWQIRGFIRKKTRGTKRWVIKMAAQTISKATQSGDWNNGFENFQLWLEVYHKSIALTVQKLCPFLHKVPIFRGLKENWQFTDQLFQGWLWSSPLLFRHKLGRLKVWSSFQVWNLH